MESQQAEPEISDTPIAVPERPGIVTFAGVLLLLYALYAAAISGFIGIEVVKDLDLAGSLLFLGSLALVWFHIDTAIGLFKMGTWARKSAIALCVFDVFFMTIAGIVLIALALSYSTHETATYAPSLMICFSLLVNGWVIYCLLRPDIVDAFEEWADARREPTVE